MTRRRHPSHTRPSRDRRGGCFYERGGKRVLDTIVSGAFLVGAAPLILAAAAAIRVESRGPAIYRQERIGREGRPFQMYKLRTMLTIADSFAPDGRSLENYERVTRVGNLLRVTSFDEIPQLINVLIGHMSLVGPRPTLGYQVERYTARQSRRLAVRPGITGLAQVSGRNLLSWEDKIALDLAYIRNVSLRQDLGILARTIPALLRSSQVAFSSHDEISRHLGDYRENI